MKVSVTIFANKTADKDFAPLRLRVRWSGMVASVNIGYSVKLSKWSASTQRVIRNSVHFGVSAQTINNYLDEITAKVETAFANLATIPTKDEITDLLHTLRYGKDECKDYQFNAVFERFISHQSVIKQWSTNTVLRLKSFARLFIECYTNTFDIRTVTLETFDKFLIFLIGKGYRNTYVEKVLKQCKWFFRFCFNNRLLAGINTDWLTYTPRLKKTSKETVFLSLAEISQIENAEIVNVALQQCRDVFLFCCYSGLRYSDVAKLRKNDITNGYIEIITQKTSDRLRIELNMHTRKILDKYKDTPIAKALPVVSNANYNQNIKRVCQLAGLSSKITTTDYYGSIRKETIKEKWELITTHTARRSFISNCIILGIPPDVIRKWTGHKDTKAMLPYIGISDKAKKNAMSLFDDGDEKRD